MVIGQKQLLTVCLFTFLIGCSDEGGTTSSAIDSAAPASSTSSKSGSKELSCAGITPKNPEKADLNDPDLRFDVDIPQGFEIRKKNENSVTTGYQIGARVVPGFQMVSFGYEIDQAKVSQEVPQILIDVMLKQGWANEAVVNWNGKLLTVYGLRNEPNRTDMKVWLPAETEGQFHSLLITTFLTAKIECPAQVSQAAAMFVASIRPKG